jgi:hypothetical protein
VKVRAFAVCSADSRIKRKLIAAATTMFVVVFVASGGIRRLTE